MIRLVNSLCQAYLLKTSIHNKKQAISCLHFRLFHGIILGYFHNRLPKMSESYNLLGQQPSESNSDNDTANHPDSGLAQTQPATPAQPASQSKSLYNSEQQKISAQDLKNAGFDLLVSQDQAEKSALQIANNPDELIENIVRQTTDTGQDEAKILSELEQMDTKLELDIPASSDNLQAQKLAKMFFLVSIAIAILAFLFFSGAANRFLAFTNIDFISESQSRLNQTQSNKVINHYLLASVALDDLAVNASRYNHLLMTGQLLDASRKRQDIEEQLANIRENLVEAARQKADNPDISSIVITRLNDQRTNFLTQSDAAEDSDQALQLKTLAEVYFGAARLYTNTTVRPLLAGKDFAEISDAELLALSEKVLFETSNNAIAKVALVELSRTRWTEIFNELQSVISNFDPDFNVFQNTDNYIISLSNYTFNSTQGTINISGEVRTDDSRTFTLIADLMDALEESPLFSNLSYTTFSKSFQENGESYRSNLNLSFNLESRDLVLNGA